MDLTSEPLKFGITLTILVIGFMVMRIIKRMMIRARQSSKRQRTLDPVPYVGVFDKVFFSFILVVALVFLGLTSVENFALRFLSLLPELLIFILLILLGILTVQLISGILEKLLTYTKIDEVISEDISRNLLPVLFIIIKIILYVVLVDIILSIIQIPELKRLANFILYPILVILFSVFFVGIINPIRDFSSGFYLKNMWAFKSGNRITFEKETYTIKNISLLHTELETSKGNFLLLPNRVLASKGLEFEKPSKEMQTLEEIKNQFVAQLPSMCGPASAQIALSIFKIESTQEEIAKLAGSIKRENKEQVAGTHPQKLIRAIEKYTENTVIGAWVDFDKIYNLKQEISTWLNDGALIIIDYKKQYLFPSAQNAHYSLVVGVKGDELLVVDPSSKSGGVYFVDYRDVLIGMDTYSDLIQGKRGYIVLAPKSSAAYERMDDGLIYYHPSMYNKISKPLEMKLNKIMNAPALSNMMPPFVKKFVKKVEKEQISRVWRP